MTKNSLLLSLLLCLTQTIFAEEGHRMLVNGRTWNFMSFYYTDADPDTVYHSISIDGPVEFDGKQCYKYANKSLEESTNFFYEEGNIVYYYGFDLETFEYGWKEQFNFDLTPDGNNVISVDTISVNGKNYRRLNLFNDIWIEGIGSIETGPLVDWGDLPGTFMGSEVVSVCDGDECIFTTDDFKKPAYTTGIRKVKSDAKRYEAIYNLNGQTIHGTPQKGVYIQNGKKVIVK